MWAAITESHSKVGQLLHLVSYRPGDKAPRDHGPVSVSNPNFTEFVDRQGKPLPFHGGFGKFGDVTTTKYVILGVCEARSGDAISLGLSAIGGRSLRFARNDSGFSYCYSRALA
jgi:hypothetical protein